jgi:heat shock protein HtpX
MNYFKVSLLLIVLTLLLVWMGGAVGGQNGAMVAFVFALVLNGISFWFSDRIVIAMYQAKEVSKGDNPELVHTVEELAHVAGIPVPRVYVAPMAMPNAFATGRSPNNACVCVTNGILNLLDKRELKGVLAHELGHIKNRDTLLMTLVAALAGAVMMIANTARWAAMFGGSRDDRDSGNVFGLIAMSIIAPLAAMLIQMAISRSREYQADEFGVNFARDKFGLMSALSKLDLAAKHRHFQIHPETAHMFITNPMKNNFIGNLFSTHPPIESRISRINSL